MGIGCPRPSAPLPSPLLPSSLLSGPLTNQPHVPFSSSCLSARSTGRLTPEERAGGNRAQENGLECSFPGVQGSAVIEPVPRLAPDTAGAVSKHRDSPRLRGVKGGLETVGTPIPGLCLPGSLHFHVLILHVFEQD